MAENEMLDPWNKNNSTRWRHFYDRVNDGLTMGEVADEAYRCLVDAVRRLYDLLPMEELINAAAQRGREDRKIAATCHRAYGYAQLFVRYGKGRLSRKEIVKHVLQGALVTVVDQMQLYSSSDKEWNGSPFPSADPILARLSTDLDKLANRIVQDPSKAPRRPSKPAEDREEERRGLTDLSIASAGAAND